MLNIEKKVNLISYNTLRLDSYAEFFATLENKDDLLEAIAWAKKNKKKIFILGGGSNILLTPIIKALVLKNDIKGIETSISKDSQSVLLTAKSGEYWTKLVNFAIQHNFYGLENLFLIYGTVGAAPIQNIGAYGVELKDVFYQLQAIDLQTGEEKTFSLNDCQFSYRDSIFKQKLKGRYFIYSLTLKLSLKPKFNLEYPSLRKELEERGFKKPKLEEVVRAIQSIRNSKLPNPGIFPNAGSFFKNVIVDANKLKEFQEKYPNLPYYNMAQDKFKIPSAWLIEQLGFKGKSLGSFRMYEKQALILVNEGKGNSRQALELINKIKSAVKNKFNLDLEEEVNIIE